MSVRYSSKGDVFLDSSGNARNGGKLNFYITLTTTRKNTYTVDALTVGFENTNPVVLDSSGRCTTDIFLSAADYKVVLTNSDGTDAITDDPVHGSGTTVLPNGGALASTGGILAKGDLTAFSSWSAPMTGVFRTDFQLEVQNIVNSNHVGLSLGNNFPVEQEAAVTAHSYLSTGAAFQQYAMFAGFTSTSNTPSDSVRNNSATASTTYLGFHLLGRTANATTDYTNLILLSNNSAIALAGSTSALPWHFDPPAISWWDNRSNQLTRGNSFHGTSGITTLGTVTSGSLVMTALSITPTTAGISAGMQISGPGIKPGTTVASFDATTITMSQTAFSSPGAGQTYQTVTYTPHSGFTFEHQGGNARIGAATWGGASVEIGTSGSVPFIQSYNRNTSAAAPMTALMSTWTITGKIVMTPPAATAGIEITRQSGASSLIGTSDMAIDGSASSGTLLLNAIGTGDIQICGGGGALQIKGAGTVAANASVATAMSSVGPVGSHTTIQEWLVVKNSGGTTRWIPMF